MPTSSIAHPVAHEDLSLLQAEHWIEMLNDGSRVLIRPIREDDRERERTFIERLSPQARHFRFLGTFKTASPALLDQLMQVDYRKNTALIALVHDNGVLREVGVSRYNDAGDGDESHCEFAVTIADDWQHRGLAVVLMRHLIAIACRNGFHQMASMDAADNEPMRELAQYLGFSRTPDPNDATQVMHVLDL
ncbi:MAG: GNAT family N-acetyltransferase [Salinisphaera sp.]|nr:GNAT family N-acetyltransferase [Salinisphaera sp.]